MITQKEVHQNAMDHGWWNCKMCKGKGEIQVDLLNGADRFKVASAVCPQCNGEKFHREQSESLALISAEVSEALESLRAPKMLHKCDKCDGLGLHDLMTGPHCMKCDGTGEALGGSRYGEELADVIIRVMDEAEFRGIDLEEVIRLKHAFNKTRPFKHGKEF